MEDVNDEIPLRRPVVHRLPGNEGQPFVDAQLSQLVVLDGVWPTPEHLPLSKAGHILQRGLGQQHHIAGRDDLLARTKARNLGGELLIGDAVAVAIAPLEEDPRPQVGVDPVEVLGMDWQPELVLLARGAKYSETELVHAPPIR
jgi:hypothetical protein